MKGFLRFLIDAVFPRRCVSCNSFTGGTLVCDACRTRLVQAEGPGTLGGPGGIRVCSPFLTCDVLLDLVRFMKFEGGSAAAGWLGGEMGRELGSYRGVPGDPVIVPVPLHWTRLLRRGYDQAELLATEISRNTGIPLRRRVLRRKKRTRAQSSLDPGGRRSNMEGAFRIRGAGKVRDRDVILVDDLVTTGETVMACCRALDTAAPASVTVLCAGRKRMRKN